MDLGKMSLFASLKKRMHWISDRQEVLAQNIANADTPGYRAKDLKPYDFQWLVQREKMHVKIEGTDPSHIGMRDTRIRDFAEERNRKPYETAPAGNQVVLEEQVMKMNETQIDHQLTTELYRKNMDLFKIAMSKK